MAFYEDFTVGKLRATNDVQIDGQLTADNVVVAGSTVTGSTLGTAAAGTITAVHENSGLFVRSTFTLTGAQVPVTDAAGSGSYGTLKLFTLPAGAAVFLGCRQNYTAFAEGAALTTAAGDAAFVLGVGSAALAAAADGSLATTSVDIGASTTTITLSGGTGAGTKISSAATAIDGTATASTINLNFSGSAATIDATSTLDVTGTITVLWSLLGDD
jgi:hypothetical protein